MDLLSMLMGSLTSQQSVDNLSEKSGGSNSQITKLLIIAIPLLIRYMTKNAASKEGASSLQGALTQHKSQKTMAEQIATADTVDGGKILGHILGNQTQSQKTVGQLANETGMTQEQVMKVLQAMAPALLSGLSAATQTSAQQQQAGRSSYDYSDMMKMFGGTQVPQQTQQQAYGMGGGLLSTLFGSGSNNAVQEEKSAYDGTSLLQSLLSLM